MADYDSASLSVDPQTINTFVNALKAQAQDVADTLISINGTLSGLALGWAGDTADEVQVFNDSWTNTMTSMFGTQDDPSKGVLNVIIGGLQEVAVGYSWTELQLAGMWQQFYTQLSSAASGSAATPTSTPPNVGNTNYTAVTEVFS
ncbi:WXG100 family type VII secretion target [Actinacidiphila oryziradicis]|uniref:WXG100 family type VII secretion target n=1 Tax=Actinacidiphila oryziradicis TaxID=2571141 RepID=A0A4U0S1Q6_9ACTN|nr:WXG100 family type VII secretion target [Actinacidiphila oryziradicis]TKA02073.1 WXG100 family type VII secretion target [Actinacidiphila oryziradicis]